MFYICLFIATVKQRPVLLCDGQAAFGLKPDTCIGYFAPLLFYFFAFVLRHGRQKCVKAGVTWRGVVPVKLDGLPHQQAVSLACFTVAVVDKQGVHG